MDAGHAQVAETFRKAAEWHRKASPLQRRLSLDIADDPDLVELASHAGDGFSPPIMLFAAVHYLLLEAPDHPLSRYYPSVSGGPAQPGDDGLYPCFREFCLEHAEAVREILRSKETQSNVVRRSAALFPAFEYVSREVPEPLAVVEVGTSAGLNLFCDRYAYDYGTGRTYGERDAAVRLQASLDSTVAIRDRVPAIAWRTGIDIDPLDVSDTEDVRWLKACLWPDDVDLHRMTERAIEVVRREEPDLRAGDFPETLPVAARDAPSDMPLLIFDTQMRHHLSEMKRDAYKSLLRDLGSERDIHWISGYGPAEEEHHVRMTYTRITDGEMRRTPLATYTLDGTTIRWTPHLDEET